MKIINRILLGLLALSWAAAASAQPSPPPGPWLQNGSAIYPKTDTGCLTLPSTVVGGCQGTGTLNATGIFIKGVPVQGFGNEPANSFLAGPVSGSPASPAFRSINEADLTGVNGSSLNATSTGSITARTLANRFADYTNVKDFGAAGNGTTDDTSAFTAAMTAACSRTGKTIHIPQSNGGYKITSTLTLCDGQAVVCDSGSQINYTGTGALFYITASQSPRIRGCILNGNNAANTYGILIGGAVSTAAVKPVFEQMIIQHFGDVATASGAGIQINTDSQAVTIRENTFSNNGPGIATTAPTDTLDIHDNLITNPAGSAASCVILGSASGATTMSIRHNNLSCNGPAVTVNAGTGVVYLTDNEQENQSGVTLSGAHSTAYDIIAAGGVIATNNTCNVHSNNSYCWYVADGIANSRFSGNTVNGVSVAGFRVGSGVANVYEYTRTDGLIALNYSVSAYPGIVSATASSSTTTYSIGLGNGIGGFAVAMPGVAYDAGDAGQMTLLDSANTNRKLSLGYDGTREVGYIQVIKSLCCAEPLLLNPKGGGVQVFAPTFPALTGYVYANGSSPATVSTTVPWASLTGTPTTLAGYGITSPLPVAQGGTASASASGTALDNITGFSGTGFIKRTGAGTYTFTADPSDVVSVSNSDGTLTVSPTSGAVVASLALGHANTWSGQQTFVAPILGTPASGVATNLTGTAPGLTAGAVTTNANLTGPITSTGNATSVAAQTGTGSTFVMNTSPTLITPALGAATATSVAVNGATIGTDVIAASGSVTISGLVTTSAGSGAISSLLAVQLGAGSGIGFYSNGSNGIVVAAGGIDVTRLTTTSIRAGSGAVIGLTSAAAGSAADGGFSRLAGASWVFGNGTPGDFSGTLKFSNLTLTALASDAATTDNSMCVTTTTGVVTKGSGTLGICLGTSSLRYKEKVTEMADGLAAITSLAAKNFYYKKGWGDGGARMQYGFIAEDVVKVLPKLVGMNEKGEPNTVDMLGMFPVMVKAMQELNARVAKLEAAR